MCNDINYGGEATINYQKLIIIGVDLFCTTTVVKLIQLKYRIIINGYVY